MTPTTDTSELKELDEFVRKFDRARRAGSILPLRFFLPGPDHPLYARVVCELARVDLEFSWSRGSAKPLSDYCAEFPEVFCNATALEEIAYEEFRQRRNHGENPSADEYVRRFRLSPDNWDSRMGHKPGSRQRSQPESHSPPSSEGFAALCRRIRASRSSSKSEMLSGPEQIRGLHIEQLDSGVR